MSGRQVFLHHHCAVSLAHGTLFKMAIFRYLDKRNRLLQSEPPSLVEGESGFSENGQREVGFAVGLSVCLVVCLSICMPELDPHSRLLRKRLRAALFEAEVRWHGEPLPR